MKKQTSQKTKRLVFFLQNRSIKNLFFGFFHFDQFLDAIVHMADAVVFANSQTSFVRNIEYASGGFGVFAVNTAGLQFQFFADFLEVRSCGNFGNLDVNRSTDGCAQVGRAESQPTQMFVTRKLAKFFDNFNTTDESVQNLTDVASLLHADNTQMIFFVNPDQESLVFCCGRYHDRWANNGKRWRLAKIDRLL